MNGEGEMEKEDFCKKFIAEMIRRVGVTFIGGGSVEEYASRIAPSYWRDFGSEGSDPIECVDEDIHCW